MQVTTKILNIFLDHVKNVVLAYSYYGIKLFLIKYTTLCCECLSS